MQGQGRGRGGGPRPPPPQVAPAAAAPQQQQHGQGRGRGGARPPPAVALPPAVAAEAAPTTDTSKQSTPYTHAPPLLRTRAEVRKKAQSLMPKRPDTSEELFSKVAQYSVPVVANFFKTSTKLPLVYQYHVMFSPTCDSRSMRYTMLTSHEMIGNETFAFDGMHLFLAKKLPDKITYLKSMRSQDNQEFEISIELVKELAGDDCKQLYNIVFKKVSIVLFFDNFFVFLLNKKNK